MATTAGDTPLDARDRRRPSDLLGDGWVANALLWVGPLLAFVVVLIKV